MVQQRSRPLFGILPPGSWWPGHALEKLGSLEYRWFKGSLRYLQHTNPTVWTARLQGFEQAARAAVIANKRGTIENWMPITGKQTYLDSVMVVSAEILNSRSLPHFGESGVAEAYNRVARGAGKIREYIIAHAQDHGGADPALNRVIQVWQTSESTLAARLTSQQLELGFDASGSCVFAKDLGLGVGDTADVLDTLALIFEKSQVPFG